MTRPRLRRLALIAGSAVGLATVSGAQAAAPAARIVGPRVATAHVKTTGAFAVPHTRIVCARSGPRCRVQAVLRGLAARRARRSIARREFGVAPGRTATLRFRLSPGRLAQVRKAGRVATTLTITARRRGSRRAHASVRLTL